VTLKGDARAAAPGRGTLLVELEHSTSSAAVGAEVAAEARALPYDETEKRWNDYDRVPPATRSLAGRAGSAVRRFHARENVASMSHQSPALNAIRSSSRSTTSRVETDGTRPAESPRVIFLPEEPGDTSSSRDGFEEEGDAARLLRVNEALVESRVSPSEKVIASS